MKRPFITAATLGSAVIYGSAALTSTNAVVSTMLFVAVAAQVTIAVGAAFTTRWLPTTRTLAVVLVAPVLLWATALLVAVTADSPTLTSALATVPLAGASLLGLIAAFCAVADARRSLAQPPARPARAAIAVSTAVLLTGLVVTPSVAATLPVPQTPSVQEELAPAIVLGDHSEHEGYAPIDD